MKVVKLGKEYEEKTTEIQDAAEKRAIITNN
jgi:hypothetical protein